jgi:hypothetical protein
LLYQTQMLAAAKSGLLIVRYEDLLEEPKRELSRILTHFGLEWSDQVLQSHSLYSNGKVGHGRIDLSQPIRQSSGPIQIKLPGKDLRLIESLTADTLQVFGYALKGDQLHY